MKLSEMRGVLDRRKIQLTKSLGQNFLHDAHQLRRIVDAAQLTRADKVLEIGPGLGPLTELLVEKAGEVLAIEKDLRLVEALREHFALKSGVQPAGPPTAQPPEGALEGSTPPRSSRGNEAPSKKPEAQSPMPEISQSLLTSAATVQTGVERNSGLRLLHDDALDFLQREPRDWSGWKLVANLPYSVASPILVELAQGNRSPQRLVATLQLEVARRLMSRADDDDYGVLTLLVQLDFEPGEWFKIPPGCFFPEPDVDSACVCLTRRAQPLLPEDQRATFKKIVKRAFSQRRKMMLKLLKQDWPLEKLQQAFAELNISPQERAEKLSLQQFVDLTSRLLA